MTELIRMISAKEAASDQELQRQMWDGDIELCYNDPKYWNDIRYITYVFAFDDQYRMILRTYGSYDSAFMDVSGEFMLDIIPARSEVLVLILSTHGLPDMIIESTIDIASAVECFLGEAGEWVGGSGDLDIRGSVMSRKELANLEDWNP